MAVLPERCKECARSTAQGKEILARADSCGASHGFIGALRDLKIRFSVGFDLTGSVREAVLAASARVRTFSWPKPRTLRWPLTSEGLDRLEQTSFF